jgi:hypothetical protein
MSDWLFRPLNPFASGLAIGAIAVAVWVLILVPLWRSYRLRVSLRHLRAPGWLAAAAIAVFVFGLWAAWQKNTSFVSPAANATGSTADASTREVNSGEQSTSPYSSAGDFAKYAMNLREQELLKVEPQTLIPTSSRPAVQRYPWKMNVVTTVFWIGEKGNYVSVWDTNWTANYGGTDNPEPSARRNYIPIAFVPRQNPFYCALPYNDVTHGQFRPEAPLVIPWFKQSYTGPGQSVCRHRWIAIRKGNRLCYAQWEDCGPFRNDHFQYVFGNERPKPNANHGAGLNVSPSVRDYLGLAPTDVTDWQFVEVRDVPSGPWRSYGDNNHFVIARRQSEQRMQQQQAGQNSE